MIKKILGKLKTYCTERMIRIDNPCIHRTVKFKDIECIKFGPNCKIGEDSYIYCWKQYSHNRVVQSLNSSLKIGKNFSATRCLTVQCCNKITIGNDVLIASNVFICDYNHGMIPNKGSYLDNELTLSEVFIGDGAWIGQGVFVMPGVTIGCHSIIGAGSVVTHNIPDYAIAVGNPAKIIKIYDFDHKEWISV